MKAAKNFLIFGIQILVLAGGVLGFFLLNQAQVKPTTVYVYTRSLEVGDVLTSADITPVTVPADVLAKNPNLITDPNDFYYFVETEYTVNEEVKKLTADEAGEGLDGESMDGEYRESLREYFYKAVNTDVFEGEFVTAEHLAKPLEVNNLKTLDYSQLRLIAIPMSDEDIIAGLINRGDRVDVLFTGTGKPAISEDTSDEFTYTTTVLEDVVVYQVLTEEGLAYESIISAYDKGLAPESFGTSIADGESGDSTYGTPGYLVLAVTPEEAEELKTRMMVGTLSVIGRFPESTSKGDALQDYILGSAGKIEAGLGSVETSTTFNELANSIFETFVPQVEDVLDAGVEETPTEGE